VGLDWKERAHSHDLDISIFSSVGRRLRPVVQRFEVVWYVKWGWLKKKKYRNILVQARGMASSVSSPREKDIGKMERESENAVYDM